MMTSMQYLKMSVLLGVCAVMAAPAAGGVMIFDLADDNSLVSVSTTAGVLDWIVDGTSQLSRQWFWYRIGDDPEVPITLLDVDAGVTGATDTNGDGLDDVAYVLYHGAGFDVGVRVSLDGGPVGTPFSDVAEQVTVTNTSAAALDFHFFQFADFDLGGTTLGDEVVHLGNGAQGRYAFNAEQVDDEWTARVAEVATETMAHCEANSAAALNAILNDGVADDLSDAEQAGPGDVAWAYQWDFVLDPGEAFMLSKDKMITPEPATLALLGGGAALALLLRRRR